MKQSPLKSSLMGVLDHLNDTPKNVNTSKFGVTAVVLLLFILGKNIVDNPALPVVWAILYYHVVFIAGILLFWWADCKDNGKMSFKAFVKRHIKTKGLFVVLVYAAIWAVLLLF